MHTLVTTISDLSFLVKGNTIDVLNGSFDKLALSRLLQFLDTSYVWFYDELPPDYLRGDICICEPDNSSSSDDYQFTIEFVMDPSYVWWFHREIECMALIQQMGQLCTSARNDQISIGVFVQPWGGNACPWYIITWAMLLMMKSDYRVVLIHNDLPFGPDYDFKRIEARSIADVIALVNNYVPVVKYSEYLEDDVCSSGSYDFAYDLVKVNRIHYAKGERTHDASFLDGVFQASYRRECSSVEALLQYNRFDRLLVYSGVLWSPGLLSKVAHSMNILCATLETANMHVYFSPEATSVHYDDIPLTVRAIRAEGESSVVYAIKVAQAEVDKRRTGSMQFNGLTQPPGQWEGMAGFALLLPNIVWDSMVIGLHTVFKDTLDWLEHTVRWLLDNTDLTIVVRRHPLERDPVYRGNDDFDALFAPFAESARFVYLPPESTVNTYSLMEQASFVCVATGTTGLEAAISGKPVLTCCDVYYAREGGVFHADTREAYEELLSCAVGGDLTVTSPMREAALLNYYASQCCVTKCDLFRPDRLDLPWKVKSADELVAHPGVQTVLESFITRTPTSLLEHRARIVRKASEMA